MVKNEMKALVRLMSHKKNVEFSMSYQRQMNSKLPFSICRPAIFQFRWRPPAGTNTSGFTSSLGCTASASGSSPLSSSSSTTTNGLPSTPAKKAKSYFSFGRFQNNFIFWQFFSHDDFNFYLWREKKNQNLKWQLFKRKHTKCKFVFWDVSQSKERL